MDKEVSEIVKFLIGKNLSISFAESVTGGMLASTLTNISGASKIFSESYITYSKDAKKRILGIGDIYLYSKECVKQMAQGLKKITNADICVSVSGLAGPSDEPLPIGTTFYDIFYKNKHHIKKIIAEGSTKEERKRYIVKPIFKDIYEIIQ